MAIDLSKPVLDAFTKEYPFIKGELVRAGNEQITNRIFNETRAGKWVFDLLSISTIDLFVERGLLAPYLSPERDAYVNEFKDPKGLWTSVYNSNLVLMYNTRLVRDKDAPRDYGDLLDPKWKGKIAVLDMTRSGTGSNQAAMLEGQFGKEFVNKLLVDQQPVVSTSRRQLTDWVARPSTAVYNARLLALVAIGGRGKSALAWTWFNGVAPNEMKPLAGRIWWSFYESDARLENSLRDRSPT